MKVIYILRDSYFREVIDTYIDYVSNPLHLFRQKETNINLYTGEIEYNNGDGIKPMPLNMKNYYGEEKVINYNLPKPRLETAQRDIIAISHILYQSYLRSDGADFRISSKKLHKLSQNYRWILRTLYRMGIIYMGEHIKDSEDEEHTHNLYNITKTEAFRPFPLNEYLKRKDTWQYKTAQHIIENYIKDEEQEEKERQDEIRKRLTANFIKRYNQSLSLIKIDSQKSEKYIVDTYIDSPRLHRLHILRKITHRDEHHITSIDTNGRLYHIGTEIPRDLKQFTNIKYTIDCKNSHLLLFNFFILQYYLEGNIPLHPTYTLSAYNVNKRYTLIHNLYNFTQEEISQLTTDSSSPLNTEQASNLHIFPDFKDKLLKNSSFKKSEIAKIEKIPIDVWLYMYRSSHGLIWDDFVDLFDEDRATVKATMFGEVFYSYTKKEKKNEENPSKYKEEFKKEYPTVFTLINDIKKSLHEQCISKKEQTKLDKPRIVTLSNGYKHPIEYKDNVLLPNLMMQLESKIFTKILTKLLNKRGFRCFGIHDAVAVMEPKDLSKEDVMEIMKKVYAEFGLVPTLSIDVFNP